MQNSIGNVFPKSTIINIFLSVVIQTWVAAEYSSGWELVNSLGGGAETCHRKQDKNSTQENWRKGTEEGRNRPVPCGQNKGGCQGQGETGMWEAISRLQEGVLIKHWWQLALCKKGSLCVAKASLKMLVPHPQLHQCWLGFQGWLSLAWLSPYSSWPCNLPLIALGFFFFF